MKYARKIWNLLYTGGRRTALLIRDRFDLIEVKILSLGLLLTLLVGLYLVYLLFTDHSLYRALSSAAFVNVMGGRGLGVAACLSAGISVFYTIVFNFYIEVASVLITYGVVVLVMRNVIQPKLLHSTVRQAELAAQGHKSKIKRYGAIGLFLFVIFPFFMTGPVIGAIIGYLLNYRAINTFLIVFSATLTSIIIYSLAGNKAILFIEQYVDIDVVKRWGTIIVGVLIVCFLIYHIKTVKKFLDSEDD
jgi:uncharacterized membrane protein